MPLDAATKAAYRALDTAALLALIPVLREEAKKAIAQLDHWVSSQTALQEGGAAVAEQLNETLAVLKQRIDDSKEDATGFEALKETFRKAREMVAFDPAEGEEFKRILLASMDDIWKRERAVRIELENRLILPRMLTKPPDEPAP
jgi:hypothetical protein